MKAFAGRRAIGAIVLFTPFTTEKIALPAIARTGATAGGLSSTQLLQKKLFDYVLATLLLIVHAIPIACFALLIKLDSPGPVFFRQPRVGLNGRIFEIWKFRTMYHNLADINGTHLTMHNDPRVTRVGHWLREWSIDEMPQIINVLSGDMAMVGPRPHAINANVGNHLYSTLVPDYKRRHYVKPGITGWAQVNGWRGETTTVRQLQQRVAHDIEYIESWTIWSDVKIMLLTIRVLLRHYAF